MRLFVHVQHLLGIGHQRRMERIVRGCVAAGIDVTVASGGHPVPGEDWGSAAICRLPVARAEGADFARLLDDLDRPLDDAWWTRRRAATLAHAQAARPDVLLVEGYPFARRAFRRELDPLLAWARALGIPVAVSVRDILVAKPDPARAAAVVETVRRSVDRVLVHGDPHVARLEDSFAAAASISDRIAYTGYVADLAPAAPVPFPERREIVVSAGGGAVGGALLRAALQARLAGAGAGLPWRLVTGPQLPAEDAAALRASAPPDVAIDRHRPDLPTLLAAARLSISQAGYNTVLELLAAGTPALLVPFAAPGESEQSQRAAILARRGRAVVYPEAELGRGGLAAAVASALALAPPAPWPLDTDGAATTAREVLALGKGGLP
ncbi:MAG: glycosyl transferase [Alphaproteobacteria bacterium]|nr:glycosyl transferase [Alphaproteobacteria bacterium]